MNVISRLQTVRNYAGAMLASAVLLVPFCLGTPASAQHHRYGPDIPSTLSPASQKVVERLGSFDYLPAETWRSHVGNVAHGEATDLDDSSWPVATRNSEGGTDAVWYRQLVEIPKTLDGYDLTGARIWFKFFARGDRSMPQIIYFNGRRVALGDDLEPIVLFDNAKPGDKILVAVKLLPTVGDKRFGGAMMKIDFASNRPDPSDLQQEFISTALLIPSLSKNPTADMATLQKAINTVDISALDADNQAKFDASLTEAKNEIEPLKPMLQQATFHLTGNSHIDAAWLWPRTETVDVVKRTFGSALQLMSEYPNYTYTQSAAQYNEWMAEKYPEMNAEIKKRIKEGRWEVVGGMWVEPDLNMPGGESTVRSILLGKRWYQKEYGVDVRIGWNPDSFGYNWQLPQIYKRSGIDYFVTQKMTWNDTNQLPLKLFWWEAPDGSKVLTYFPQGYGNTDMDPVRLSTDYVSARKRSPGLDVMMDLFGVGDHGGGATRSVLDQADHWMEPNKIVPKMQYGTAQPFFTHVEQEIASDSPTWDYKSIAKGYVYPTDETDKIHIPTWDDELYLEYHRGVFTTQANHKRNMRDSEEWTLNAEKYASLAWLQGDAYPNARFTDAWEKITFNQFHDLAAGSGIGIIYKDAQKDYDQVRWETNEASNTALHTLSSEVDTQTAVGVPVFVFNTLGWQRSGVTEVDVQLPSSSPNGVSVLDASNHVLPSEVVSTDEKTHTYKVLVEAKNVPSMGYQVLHVVPGTKPFVSDLKASGFTLENAALRVVVDPSNGCITSIFDKKSNFETLAAGGCGNQLQTFVDKPKDYDAWNIDPGTLDHNTPISEVDSVKLIDKGPMRATIRVARTWQKSKFVQDITLYAGSDKVVIGNDIDWHETHVLLKAAFPLSASSPEATYEIPFGTIQRATTRNNSWEKARFEVPAIRWADLGDAQHGFSLINATKYGYDGDGNVLRLSLLRSPIYPDPNADRGPHHFSYELYPHAGSWQSALTERAGYEFNYKLHASQVESHTGSMPREQSYVSVSPDNVVLTAVKKAEDDNGLIFRVFEWAGKQSDVTFTLPKGATSATETNLMEKPIGSPLSISGDKVTIPIHPFEILTIRADYPHAQMQAQNNQ